MTAFKYLNRWYNYIRNMLSLAITVALTYSGTIPLVPSLSNEHPCSVCMHASLCKQALYSDCNYKSKHYYYNCTPSYHQSDTQHQCLDKILFSILKWSLYLYTYYYIQMHFSRLSDCYVNGSCASLKLVSNMSMVWFWGYTIASVIHVSNKVKGKNDLVAIHLKHRQRV